MGQITSRRFRRKTEDSSGGDKAFSANDIARNDQHWTPFEFSKPSKSVSAGQCLASISAASESQGHLTAVNSATLNPHPGALEERLLVGHRSELTIASGQVDHFNQRKAAHQRLACSDVILRKNAPGSGNGRKLEGVLFSDDSKVSEVLSQTVTFLSYEIDPILIAEFIQRRAKRANRRTASESGRGEGGSRLTCCDSDEDVSRILSRIVSDLNSDEYRSFCDLIRTIGCDGHVLDFLEALDDLLRLMTSSGAANHEETPVLETKRRAKDPCGGCTCALSSDDERIFWNRTPSSSSSSSSSHSVGDRRFEIRFVYADRESRLAQSFPDVEQLKRRKRRRSRLPSVDGARATVAVGDTSDRYVPMISVHLFNACLCDSQMRRLGRILETKACVRDLSIAKTQLDTSAKLRLGHAVSRNAGLFQLDLRGSTLGNDGAMYLANSLRHNRSVRILNLSANGINGRGCAVLARALSRNRTVTDLDLGSNEVGDAGCGCLSVLIADNCSLRRLRLSSNAIGSGGAALLFLSLRTNSQLESLDVADNAGIGDAGVGVLSEVLILNHTLRELALDRCGVTEVGCRAFARTLKANMKLRRLRLSDNPLMDGGLGSLADGIKFNRSLEDLDFTGCGITDVGLLRLLDATRYNGTLRSVRLCRNDVTVTSRASFPPSMPSSSSSWHRIWAWKVLETGGDNTTASGDADTPVDAFEIYTKLRQANPNLSIVLKDNGITRTVV